MVDYEGEGKQMPDFNALDKLKNSELPPWAVRQQKVFTNWINNKVAIRLLKADNLFRTPTDGVAVRLLKVAVRLLKVDNLFTDLTDGVVLYNLLEVLSRQSLAVLGKIRPERNRIKKVANMNIVWKYLGTTVRLVGIGPIDIVDGNTTLTLGMIWSLIVFFMAKDLGESEKEDLASLKRKIMEWLKGRTKHHPDINVHNFTDSLADGKAFMAIMEGAADGKAFMAIIEGAADGKAFMAIMEGADPVQCPYTPSADPKENLRRAFKNAENLFGVGSILDPEDPACCSDKKANITNLAELLKVMPEVETAPKANITYLAELMKVMPEVETAPVVKKGDPRQQALDYAAAHPGDPIDRLKELCAIRPRDEQAAAAKALDCAAHPGDPVDRLKELCAIRAGSGCKDPVDRLKELRAIRPKDEQAAAAKVAQFMEDAGMQGVHVMPANVAGSSAPYIVGEREGPAGAPTVLLYCTYGSEEDDEATAAKWASDPFDAKIEDGRITAKAAFQDKANVVAPLAAIEALLKGPQCKDLPCTLRILVGGTPPPQAQKGDAPLALTDGLADFIRAHPGDVGVPDYVIVSDPGGSTLAPDKATVGFGCRGFATMDIRVSTFVEEKDASKQEKDASKQGKWRFMCNYGPIARGKRRSVCDYGGPLLDPAFVLATILASLRDSETGELCVEGVKGAPDKVTSEKLRHIHFGEHHLRPHTGYKPEIPCAKESYVRDGVVSYVRDGVVVGATIAEQLTLLPAVTVTSLAMSSGKENGPVSAEFALWASASLHLCLAPEQDVGQTIKALKAHINAAVPFGVEVEYSNIRGHRGWSTHPNAAIVEALSAARGLAECRRGAVAVGSPNFQPLPCAFAAALPSAKPLPCAFAAALPSAKVVTFGVHDADAHAAAANESARAEDISDYVRTTIELLHYLAHGPPKPEEPLSPSAAADGGGDARTAYAAKHMDDLERRQAANKHMDDLERRQAANKMRAGGSLSPGALLPPPPLSAHTRDRSNSGHRLSLQHGTGLTPVSVSHPPSPTTFFGGPSPLPPGSLSMGNSPMAGAAAAADARRSSGRMAYMEGVVKGPPPPLPPRSHARGGSILDPSMLPAKILDEVSAAAAAAAAAALLPLPLLLMRCCRCCCAAAAAPLPLPLRGINTVRADPAGYALRELEPLLHCYGAGGVYTPPGGGQPRVTSEGANGGKPRATSEGINGGQLRVTSEGVNGGKPRDTSEGVKALEDALLVLKRTPPAPPLSRIPEMDKASQDHASDLGETGQTSHAGSDGSKTADRINRYGQASAAYSSFFQVAGEVISVYESSAVGIVCQMLINDGERTRQNEAKHEKIINDGERTRQNRKSIIGQHFKVCGVATAPHPSVGTVGVVTLAGGWGPKSLEREALVSVEPGEDPSPEFERVLESIPVPQVTDEVRKAIAAGLAVELDYKPGEVKLTVKQRDGSASLLSCQWG
ncbi:hypothetical protein JKP88DRAFT_346660 [Tribonema minus]|uniref:Calponin-homology (CH) domain-containing protein n=1 Tax=Tribonema minus TaxID=303371 RepID=A0A836CD41_9STRA|nr:hypothetical protein JKP88DRAFT_346660 [Tribonema minus]